METNRKPHLIWLKDKISLFRNAGAEIPLCLGAKFHFNQRDNYMITRQMYNQWSQIESLVSFVSWTQKELPHEANQRDNYVTMSQMYNQWTQVESLALFGSWTQKKLPLENNQRDYCVTTRQKYNQWRQIESHILFGSWT